MDDVVLQANEASRNYLEANNEKPTLRIVRLSTGISKDVILKRTGGMTDRMCVKERRRRFDTSC